MKNILAVWVLLLLAATLGTLDPATSAQAPRPYAVLVEAPPLTLPGEVDSNSPAMWSLVMGRPRLHITTSAAGQPRVASGARLARLADPHAVDFVPHPGHGVWMEAIVADDNGTWYGYYHNEIPAELCGRPERMIPRIGAARSTDQGRTWVNLGIVLEAPAGGHVCNSPNGYFVGGVGDLSVMLDRESAYLYFFFSQYSRPRGAQGVAVARMPWSDRDAPVSELDVWVRGAWLPPLAVREEAAEGGPVRWDYPAGTPLAAPRHPWHDGDPVTDAFWGPSVHWNTSLERYVMLLNRTNDENFGQEGIYVAFAPRLDDPRLWSPPERILTGGDWYPQVIGLEPAQGTDKLAGSRARFFMSGRSNYEIQFGYR